MKRRRFANKTADGVAASNLSPSAKNASLGKPSGSLILSLSQSERKGRGIDRSDLITLARRRLAAATDDRSRCIRAMILGLLEGSNE